MTLYLPIAGLSVNALLLLALGGGVGFLSGLFGVGGGFLLTPFLIFMGISPAVAVATGANQVVGTSVSGVLAHWRRGNVDVRMGVVLLVGGLVGSSFGVHLFAWLQRMGHVDLVINLCYVAFLSFIGTTMGVESLLDLVRRTRMRPRKRHNHRYSHLPFKVRFPKSGLYISLLLPIGVGVIGGFVSPWFVGYLKDVTGDFRWGLGAVGCLAILAAAALYAVGRVRQASAAAHPAGTAS